MIGHDVLMWALASAAAPKARQRTPDDAQQIDRRVRELFERARSESRPRHMRHDDQEQLIKLAVLGYTMTAAGAVLLRRVAKALSS